MGWDGGEASGRRTTRMRKGEKRSSGQGKTKETNLVSNPKVELRGRVKAKILPAVHRKI